MPQEANGRVSAKISAGVRLPTGGRTVRAREAATQKALTVCRKGVIATRNADGSAVTGCEEEPR